MDVWDFSTRDRDEIRKSSAFFQNKRKGRVVALGYFDGVHKGHSAILEEACKLADFVDGIPAVHTFSSAPVSKGKNHSSSCESGQDAIHLTTYKEKEGLLRSAGIEEIMLFPFDQTLSETSAEDFLENDIKDLLGARGIVAGSDYRFGRNREGTVEYLRRWCQREGIEIRITPQQHVGDKVVSSSKIRQALLDGRTDEANALLGYPISFSGVVEKGFQIGRTMQFPTANTRIEQGKIVPRYGVYATVFYCEPGPGAQCEEGEPHRMGDGFLLSAVSNIGLRPTFLREEKNPVMETVLLKRNCDLYGKRVRVFLLSFVRPERRFSSVPELEEQVRRDIECVQNYHDSHIIDHSIYSTSVLL